MRLENLGVVLLLAVGALACDPPAPSGELEPWTPPAQAESALALPLCSALYVPDGMPPGIHCKQACEVQAITQCGATVSVNFGSTTSTGGTPQCTQNPPTHELLGVGTTQDVFLTCTDPQNNRSEQCVTSVTVTDHTVPTITLLGGTPDVPVVECGLPYTDPGATANDPCEGDLTHRIEVTSTLNTNSPGSYTISYRVQDSKGQLAPPVSRTVMVKDTLPPKCPMPIEVEAGSDGKASVTPEQIQATDTCSRVTVSGPNERFPVGTHVVTFTATDVAGNQATCPVTVTVRSAGSVPPPPIPPKDRAMLGGGCSAAARDTLVPLVGLALVLLSLRRVSPRARQPGRATTRTWLGWLILGMLSMSHPSAAQPAGLPAFELERLRLNPSGMGSWVVGTGELLPAGGYRLALVGHYENKPLSLYEDGALLGVIVRHRVTTVLSGAVGLGGRVELGAQVPLLLFQQGDDLTEKGVGTPQGGVSLGTPLITARFSLLSAHREDPVDLAVGLSASPGLGSDAALARELHAIPNVMLGRRFEQVRVALDAGLMLRPSKVLNNDANVQDEVGHFLRFGAGLASIGDGLGGEVAAIGSVPLRREGFSLELLSGVRLPAGKWLELHGMAGLGLGNAPGIPRFRLLFGMAFGKVARPPKPVPEDASESSELEDTDWDKDGVLNRVDACPDEPGPAAHRGCPVLDSDGDGVVDEKDQCPRKPGIVEMAGCPRKDTDKDTVWDHEDNCREIPGPPENQGCPADVRQLVVIKRRQIAIKDTIHFDYDKDTIKSVSFPLLNQVAQVLNEHPEIVSVSIEGHTDDTGSDSYNRDLALRRAGSVRNYLEGKGVARSRMSVRGFGEDRPLTTNATEEGRAINRRVEFITRYESDTP